MNSSRPSGSTSEPEHTVPKFAANLTMMFNEVAFPQRFAAAAAAGFKAVEFLFPYDHPAQEVASWLKEHHLENVLFNLPPGDWAGGERGIAALPGREEEFRAGVARGIEYALALGTKRVHMMAGLIPSGADLGELRDVYLDNLRYAAREMGKHGITLLIEPINGRDMPNYFLHSQAEGHALREASGEANVKVQMDFYHAQIVEGDLAKTFAKYFDGIGHVQIASVPDRNEPDDGEVNYPYLFRLLDKLGYEGWIGCEYRPRGKTEDGLGWLAAASTQGDTQ
jgi:hydroxypyruvate isomerase